MTLQVYLDPCTVNSRKVLAGLDLLGVAYDFHLIDYFKGEQKSEAFMRINPHATVPAATHGDLTLTESNAILMYAAELDGAKGRDSAYPRDLQLRADANRWLLWEASVWFQTNYIYLVEYVVKPLLGATPDEDVIAKEAPKWNRAASILDSRLAQTGKWILPGAEPSIVDVAIGAPMHLHAAQRLPLSQHAHLSRWLRDLEALPSWQKTQAAVDRALLPGEKQQQQQGGEELSGPKEVRAEFCYTCDMGETLTELYFYEDPRALEVHAPGDDARPVVVANGWSRAHEFDVDVHGFALREFRSSLDARPEQWEREEQVRATVYPETAEFLRRELGARRVLVFDHTIRTRGNAAKKLTQETDTSQRAPVMLVHCDYTAESGPRRVRQLLPPAEADELLAAGRRVAFVNVWKPLRLVEEKPLAMCDATTSPPADFFKLYLRYRDRTGENYVLRHNAAHRWWYFPHMRPAQCLLLKTYDSDEDGRARFVGHSAFEDPTSRPDAPPRESCEIRTICFF